MRKNLKTNKKNNNMYIQFRRKVYTSLVYVQLEAMTLHRPPKDPYSGMRSPTVGIHRMNYIANFLFSYNHVLFFKGNITESTQPF